MMSNCSASVRLGSSFLRGHSQGRRCTAPPTTPNCQAQTNDCFSCSQCAWSSEQQRACECCCSMLNVQYTLYARTYMRTLQHCTVDGYTKVAWASIAIALVSVVIGALGASSLM